MLGERNRDGGRLRQDRSDLRCGGEGFAPGAEGGSCGGLGDSWQLKEGLRYRFPARFDQAGADRLRYRRGSDRGVYGAGTETVMVVVLTMPPLAAVMVTVPDSGGGGEIWKVAGAVTVCWGT